MLFVALALVAAGCDESGKQPRDRSDLIAFTRGPYGDRGTLGLYVVRPDGTGERRLTAPGSWCLAPAWSPEGTRLAYVDVDSGFYTVAPDGRSRKLINRYGSKDSRVVGWAPDGKSLAVTVRLGPHLAPPTAAIVPAEGGPLEDLVVRDVPQESYDSVVYGPPTWSPDSHRLAYSQGPGHPWGFGGSPERIAAAGIYTLRPDGSDRRRLTRSGRAREYVGHWLRDGRILFTRSEEERLTVYSVEEGEDDLTKIAQLAGWDYPLFAVSNDERSIAWLTDTGIHVVSLDGGSERVLADSKDARELAWSPDDRSIAFTRGGSIWVLDLDEQRARRITPAQSGDENPTWRPAG